jgi:zinc protease
VLGGGFYATRLYRDLRQKKGYVYNVDNSLRATETRAMYSVTYGCDPENVSKARSLVEEELAAMRTTNVSPAELQQAKSLLLRQITLSESSEDAVAGGFVAHALKGWQSTQRSSRSARSGRAWRSESRAGQPHGQSHVP